MLGCWCHLQDAQARSAQLLLLQKVTDLGILHQKVTCLHADLGKLTKAKEVNAQVSCKTTMFDRFDLVVMMHQPFSCLWEISNLYELFSGIIAPYSSQCLMIYSPLVFQDDMEEMEGLRSELRVALLDRDGAAEVCVCD